MDPFALVSGIDIYGDLPDFTVEDIEIDKLGVLSASVSIKRPYPLNPAWLIPWQAPAIFGPVPCSKIRAGLQDRDGMCNLSYHYEGVLGTGDFSFPENQAQCEVDCQTSAQPIQLHRRFYGIAKKYDGQFDDAKKTIFTGFAYKCPKALLGNATLDPDDPNGPRNPLYGTEDFEFPRVIFRRTILAGSLPDDLLDRVGFIDDSIANGVAGVGQQPPALKGRENWLLANVRASFRGNVWQITFEWWRSDPNGWNEDLYRRTT